MSDESVLNNAGLDDADTNDPWARLSLGRCRHLVSKEMFYDNGIPLDQRSGSGIFWCEHTHRCLGPDNMSCSAEECTSARACYES